MKKVLAAIMVLFAYSGVSGAGVVEQARQMAGDKAGAISLPAVSMPDKMAGDRLADLPGATAFDKLKALFEEGVPPAKKDLTGWYAGRSVYSKDKSKFESAIIVGKEVSVNSGGGPLFDGEKVFQIFSFTDNRANDYYDTMSTTSVA